MSESWDLVQAPPPRKKRRMSWARMAECMERVSNYGREGRDDWDFEQLGLELKLPSAVYTWQRKRLMRRATPRWADRKAMRRKYTKARRLTMETGIKHAVDHVIPLQGRQVCGLHVPNNLRVITAQANSKKNNLWADR
jgi:hypothetical protein